MTEHSRFQSRKIKMGLLLLGSAMATWPALASAQAGTMNAAPAEQATDATAAMPADAGSEIIVTAQKRADRAQDVPISLGVLGGSQITRSGITTVTQLAAKVPNVSITNPWGDTQPSFVIRGVTMADYAMNQQSPIAIYIDEVYKGVGALQGLQLYDLERLEILRGPQGTLYGKNATGGAVNFYTRSPTFDGTQGYLSLGYGNYDRKQAEGAINTTLGDKVAVRFAGTYERADGWQRELLPGVADPGSKNNYAFRAGIRYAPDADTDILLKASVSRTRSSGIPDVAVDGPGGVFFTDPPYSRSSLGYYEDEKSQSSDLHSSSQSVSLTVKHTLPNGWDLTSITSYDHGKLYNYEDTDDSPFNLANIRDSSIAESYAQDLRLSKDAGNLKILVGAYYNHEQVHYSEFDEFFFEYGTYDPVTGASSCAADGITGCRWVNDIKQIKTSAAIYGNLNFQISPSLEAAAGLRYTHDVARLPQYQAWYDFHDAATGLELHKGIVTITEAPIKRAVNNNVSYKIGLNYKPSRDVLLYATYSTGYRGASFNGLAFNTPDQITVARPEQVYSTEVGEKIQLLDRRVTLNSAVFHYTYKDQQALGLSGVANIATVFNAPKANIWGGEYDISVEPVRQVRLTFGGGYTDGRYAAGIINGRQVKGHTLIGAARWTLNNAIAVTPVDNERYLFTLGADANYTGRRYFDINQDDAVSQAPFWMVNANVSLEFKELGVVVSAWGRNLTGAKFYTQGTDVRSFLNQIVFGLGEPRMYGVKVRKNF